jgi:hypothetical protein
MSLALFPPSLPLSVLLFPSLISFSQNPGFDEDHTGCNEAPSWSQYNSTNLFSVCPEEDYYMVSPPNAMFLYGLQGWAGAVQTIDVDQTAVTSFNFSCTYQKKNWEEFAKN